MIRVNAFFARARARLLDALARYLAQPLGHPGPAMDAELPALAATLRCGDVLLTNGNTRAAALVRRVTRSSWAHVCMYVGPLEEGADPRCIVEADVAAGVRAIRLSELGGLKVRVLRPAALADAELRSLADWVVARIGDPYDMAHAWALAKLLLLPLASRLAPPVRMAEGASRFICTSLLAQAFVLVGYQLVPGAGVGAARAAPAYVVPRDFESASGFELVE